MKLKFDLFDDEKKPLTLHEFRQIIEEMASEFEDDFNDKNDFMRDKHTFFEWMKSFRGWMSF